jgi:diguanylate cyclase (GGDEF)-like protein/PAS domain S-box-containing protein
MSPSRTKGYPVLIIGAGRGGTALLEMFLEDSLVNVIGIVDINLEMPGIKLAKQHGVLTFDDDIKALEACKKYPDCIIYNLSHDDSIAPKAARILGGKRVTGGSEVKLFWQMVTNLKQMKSELETSQGQLQAIIHNVMDGIVTINSLGQIQGFNPAAETIFGYSQQEVLGKNMQLLMPEPNRSLHDSYLKRYVESGEGAILGIRGREMTALRKNGEEFPMEISASEMQLGGNRYFIGIIRDITERKRAEQKIAHLAHFDSLTDLPNRASFVDILDHSISLAKRNVHKVAVLFLDLDGFKAINDTLGHQAGDLLLQSVSKRLKESIRDSDAVARVGGDEFILVLENVESNENANQVANKIIAALSQPFDLAGQLSHIGGSIGISLFPDNAETKEELIKQADEAMYLAKQSGKNTSRFYQDVLNK